MEGDGEFMASVADLLARLAGVVLPDEWLGPNGEAHAEHMQRSLGAAVVDYMSSGVSLAGAQSAAVVATLLREHRMTSTDARELQFSETGINVPAQWLSRIGQAHMSPTLDEHARVSISISLSNPFAVETVQQLIIDCNNDLLGACADMFSSAPPTEHASLSQARDRVPSWRALAVFAGTVSASLSAAITQPSAGEFDYWLIDMGAKKCAKIDVPVVITPEFSSYYYNLAFGQRHIEVLRTLAVGARASHTNCLELDGVGYLTCHVGGAFPLMVAGVRTTALERFMQIMPRWGLDTAAARLDNFLAHRSREYHKVKPAAGFDLYEFYFPMLLLSVCGEDPIIGPVSLRRVCTLCGEAGHNFCIDCRTVYCSTRCSHQHWPTHKRRCRVMQLYALPLSTAAVMMPTVFARLARTAPPGSFTVCSRETATDVWIPPAGLPVLQRVLALALESKQRIPRVDVLVKRIGEAQQNRQLLNSPAASIVTYILN